MLLCNQCGSELTPGFTFCTACGAHIGVAPTDDFPTLQVRSLSPVGTAPNRPPQPAGAFAPGLAAPTETGHKPNPVPWLVALVGLLFVAIIGLAVALTWSPHPISPPNNKQSNQPATTVSQPTTDPNQSAPAINQPEPPPAIDPCQPPAPAAFSCSGDIARLETNANLYSQPMLVSRTPREVRDNYLIAQHFQGAKLCVLETKRNNRGDFWYKVRVMEYGAHAQNSSWTGKKNVRETSEEEKDRYDCAAGDEDASDIGWVKELDGKTGQVIVRF